jgi:hypothetical protein
VAVKMAPPPPPVSKFLNTPLVVLVPPGTEQLVRSSHKLDQLYMALN